MGSKAAGPVAGRKRKTPPSRKARPPISRRRAITSARKSSEEAFKAHRGQEVLTHVMDDKGLVQVGRVAGYFSMSKAQLAETIGIRPETLHRQKRVTAAKTQTRVREMLEIVGRVADWAGGKHQAMAWYRAEPIPAFGQRTAESLVKEGKAAAVRDYLDDVALGGFA